MLDKTRLEEIWTEFLNGTDVTEDLKKALKQLRASAPEFPNQISLLEWDVADIKEYIFQTDAILESALLDNIQRCVRAWLAETDLELDREKPFGLVHLQKYIPMEYTRQYGFVLVASRSKNVYSRLDLKLLT